MTKMNKELLVSPVESGDLEALTLKEANALIDAEEEITEERAEEDREPFISWQDRD